VPATTSTLSVKFQTSTGTISIPIDHLQLYLNAATLLGDIFMNPQAKTSETINVNNYLIIPSEEVSISFGDT